MTTHSALPFLSEFRVLLLDIEGTITPIDFVYKILFPYVHRYVRAYIEENKTFDLIRTDIDNLAAQHRLDAHQNTDIPPWKDYSLDTDAIEDYIKWLMSRDSKAPALKSLQGKVWDSGYRRGLLRSQIYDDVVLAMKDLKQKKRRIFLYSSGSVLAQRLLITYSEHGDLSQHIDGYFDTSTGAKTDPKSYLKIASAVKEKSGVVLFISDVVSELDAAQDAGMMTLLSLRSGNPPQQTNSYQSIKSFKMLLA